MQFIPRHLNLLVISALTLISTACSAQESSTQPISAQTKAPHTVSAEQIRAALSSPEERTFKTLLGTLIIKHSNGKTPGKIFLNGELIYTARVDEIFAYNRSGHESFDLWVAANGLAIDDNNNGLHPLQ